MDRIKSDIVIVGAGLTGLTLAYYLRHSKLTVHIVEARNRLGGRILTTKTKTGPPIELGATWLGKNHTELLKLLNELELKLFDQRLGPTAIYEPISTSPHQLVNLPPNNDPSFRVVGGTDSLTSKLASAIDPKSLILNEPISSIEKVNDRLLVQTNSHQLEARYVVSTIPPNLFIKQVKVTPSLPAGLEKVANNTHTWMGDSIKIGLMFEKPFWREKGISGTLFSNVGPVPEMYDHSNFEDNLYALKGFLNGAYYNLTSDHRKSLVLSQLRKYYGNLVDEHTDYAEMAWRNETYSFVPNDSHVLPHQNNGHQVFQQSYMDGTLLLAGTETSPEYPGYMEGAVRSAQQCYRQLIRPSDRF